jgi:SOS response associated peptidase (SRAP)
MDGDSGRPPLLADEVSPSSVKRLVPSWAKDPKIGSRLINARMETRADKPAFRRAFTKRRAVIPPLATTNGNSNKSTARSASSPTTCELTAPRSRLRSCPAAGGGLASDLWRGLMAEASSLRRWVR